MKRSLFAFLVLALLAMVPAQGKAAEADFGAWLKLSRAEALGKGIGSDTLDRALAGLTPIKRVVELDRRQPEFTLNVPSVAREQEIVALTSENEAAVVLAEPHETFRKPIVFPRETPARVALSNP